MEQQGTVNHRTFRLLNFRFHQATIAVLTGRVGGGGHEFALCRRQKVSTLGWTHIGCGNIMKTHVFLGNDLPKCCFFHIYVSLQEGNWLMTSFMMSYTSYTSLMRVVISQLIGISLAFNTS